MSVPPPSSTNRTPSSSRNPLTAGATLARPPTLCLPAPHTTRTALASVLAAPANTVLSTAVAPSAVRPCRSTVSGGRLAYLSGEAGARLIGTMRGARLAAE